MSVYCCIVCLGVTCACRSSRRCSLYDICCRRCLRTVDRSGCGLPVLQESGTDRSYASSNKTVEQHVNANRDKWSKVTRQLQGKYRLLQKRITTHLSSLVLDNELPYWSLKRCIHNLRRRLKDRALGGNPGVENMLNEFYPPFYDVDSLKKLITRVEECLGRPIPVKAWLQCFEKEVDDFLSSRVILRGVDGDGHHNVIFCIDPEWSDYPACDLYKVHKRVGEALHRVRGQLFAVVYFCTVLKGYVLLSCIENFARKMREKVEGQPIDVADNLAGSPLSKVATSALSAKESNEDQISSTIKEAEGIRAEGRLPPTVKEVEGTSSVVASENKYERPDHQVIFPFPVKCEARSHSVLITGSKLVHSMIYNPIMMGGWSSLDFYISKDLERVSLVNDIVFKPFLYQYSFD